MPQQGSKPRFRCFLQPDWRTAEPLESLRVAPGIWVQPGPTIPLALSLRTQFRDSFLSGYPWVWVEDAGTGMLCPFWIPHAWYLTVAALRPCGEASQLADDVASALLSAGVLIDPLAARHALHKQQVALAAAAGLFQSGGYAYLSGVLHPAQVEAYRTYYGHLTRSMSQIGDSQCSRRYGIHNESLSRFLHHQFSTLVERIAGTPVMPSYCYFAGYCEGAELTRHTDREQCEFSVSLLLDYEPVPDGESPWPLWLETAEGDVQVHQAVGDALLYRGTQLPHWREVLPEGNRSYSLLLHYVSRDFRGSLR